jgi:hypothetical protein
MESEPPQPQDPRPRGPFGHPWAWCLAAGVVLSAVTLACLALGVISTRQAIGLAMPIIVFLVAALALYLRADAVIVWRLGFQAGWRAGWLVRRWRSIFRR